MVDKEINYITNKKFVMPFIPQCKWFMDENIDDVKVFPKCTFIEVGTCMACGRSEGVPDRLSVNTLSDFPSYIFITCKSKDCVRKTMTGLANFYRTYGEYIMLFGTTLRDCMVMRSSGDVEGGWTARGFICGNEGVEKMYMVESEKNISKVVLYDDFIDLNKSKSKDLAFEINMYFMNMFNHLNGIQGE